jgi:hypothetical protein
MKHLLHDTLEKLISVGDVRMWLLNRLFYWSEPETSNSDVEETRNPSSEHLPFGIFSSHDPLPYEGAEIRGRGIAL